RKCRDESAPTAYPPKSHHQAPRDRPARALRTSSQFSFRSRIVTVVQMTLGCEASALPLWKRALGSSFLSQLGFTAPDVQDESLVVAMVAPSFMAFSASPHCHWAAVLMFPPPTRLSTHIPRSWPVTESVIFASASAPPMKG